MLRVPPHRLHVHAALPKSADWFLLLYLGFHPSVGDGLLSLRHNITGRQWLICNSIWTKYPWWNGNRPHNNCQHAAFHKTLFFIHPLSCSPVPRGCILRIGQTLQSFVKLRYLFICKNASTREQDQTRAWFFRLPVSDTTTFWYPWISEVVFVWPVAISNIPQGEPRAGMQSFHRIGWWRPSDRTPSLCLALHRLRSPPYPLQKIKSSVYFKKKNKKNFVLSSW